VPVAARPYPGAVGTLHSVDMRHNHRNLSKVGARAAVFGVSDGLVSNVALILAWPGLMIGPGGAVAGVAASIAGSFSMAAGEYVSMRAHPN